MKFLLLPCLFLSLGCSHKSLSQHPPVGTNCGILKYGQDWKYCFTASSDLNNKEIIYYFHGGGGSEADWIDPKNYPTAIREYWKNSKKIAPNVVAVSTGDLWGFSDKVEPNKKLGSYEEFLSHVMPDIENNILKFKPTIRIALGESMGGFNAAVVSLRNPNLFSKAALICPGVLREAIFSQKELEVYSNETGAKNNYLNKISYLLQQNFSSAEEYRRFSPQSILKSFNNTKKPKLFLSCGKSDEFGFFKESETFVEMAQNKNFQVIWRPVNGKHCSLDIESLAKFLVE